MTEPDETPGAGDAAAEAAQNVVDEVTSWEYSAERDTIEDQLDQGLDDAGVTVDEGEKQRIVDEVDQLKNDETAGTPEVGPSHVEPADGS